MGLQNVLKEILDGKGIMNNLDSSAVLTHQSLGKKIDCNLWLMFMQSNNPIHTQVPAHSPTISASVTDQPVNTPTDASHALKIIHSSLVPAFPQTETEKTTNHNLIHFPGQNQLPLRPSAPVSISSQKADTLPREMIPR